MLEAHPLLAIPAETHFVPGVIARWRRLERAGAPAAARRRELAEFITSHHRWPDMEVEASELEAHLESLEPLTLAGAARAVHVVHARGQGKPRWGDKTPGYLVKIRRIATALPEARFVHVIRDGRDVAVSLAGVSWGADDPEVAAAEWRDRIRAARVQASGLAPGRYLEVRYESLVTDPQGVLETVAGAVDLPWDDLMLTPHHRAPGRLAAQRRDLRAPGRVIAAAEREAQHALAMSPPTPERVGRWRRDMPDDARRRFEAAAGDLLDELGYSLGPP